MFFGTGPKIGSFSLITREVVKKSREKYTISKSAKNFASIDMQHDIFWRTSIFSFSIGRTKINERVASRKMINKGSYGVFPFSNDHPQLFN